jgi:PAS domain S-box-containing protein
MQVLERQYQVVETYSNNIIQRVGDGIIVFDEDEGIKVYNEAAEDLFQQPADEVLGEPLESLLEPEQCGKILSSVSTIKEMSCMINNRRRYLLVSRNSFTDENDVENTILVIRDLTEQKNLEAQIQRKERLSAMGELASGVAHEIRNPLNTIGTIVQQLNSDFEPSENSEEFHELNSLVYKEVKRINQTIQDFLRFSRPEAMNVETFPLDDLVDQMKQQYESMAREKSLQLSIDQRWNGQVVWDRNQIQQVLMNLLQNAMDAVETGGEIRLTLRELDEYTIEIKVADNGPGIPEEIRNKIFNLYYTTKPQGTGIGLSMVQRIIDEHGGVITLESEPGSGTTFTIRLPKTVSTNEQVTA